MKQKVAVLVLSDPRGGTEESLGRLFNALSTTYELKQRGDEVQLVFSGTGTRWAAEVVKPEHPAHALYRDVSDVVAGVSCGCAEVFGARESAERSGFELISEVPVPGTSGVPSVARLVEQGYTVLSY